MIIFKTILICLLAGMGAGLGTGFAGMSAAAVITPMLVTFLGIEPYTAVGIALASDVLASAVSAYTYGKNKNLDIKNGVVMMASVLLFTVVGSYVSSLVPSAQRPLHEVAGDLRQRRGKIARDNERIVKVIAPGAQHERGQQPQQVALTDELLVFRREA